VAGTEPLETQHGRRPVLSRCHAASHAHTSDTRIYQWLVQNAQRGTPQATCRTLWDELYAAAAGKDVVFEWRRRDQSLGSRLAHQLARDAARGRK
jgi:hypothetical protein